MAFDSARGEVLMFGGASNASGNAFLCEAWGWNGTTWTESSTSGPSARTAASVLEKRDFSAFDAGAGRVLVSHFTGFFVTAIAVTGLSPG
jgi:hypothetical protein